MTQMINTSGSTHFDRSIATLARSLILVLGFALANTMFAADEPEANKSVELLNRKPGRSDFSVAASLYWFSRHQAKEGNWSLRDYSKLCQDKTCTGSAKQESLSAATALALIPMLTAGMSHSSDGPFRKTIKGGINWLVSHQTASGDLSAGAAQQMYSHGLATIALCEDYGRTRDITIGKAAQKAINFIQDSQNSTTGGWGNRPGEKGDTSDLGWQITALRSGQMAGLQVKPAVFDLAKKYLAAVAKQSPDGKPNGQFSDRPDGKSTLAMSAIGLRASLYMHGEFSDPLIAAGEQYLVSNPSDMNSRDAYYWFFATQVLHDARDRNWDVWNRKVRKILLDSQAREGCAAGSWDPQKPTPDAAGVEGGRIAVTSLSCLILEVPYKWTVFSPRSGLYKLDTPAEITPGAGRQMTACDGTLQYALNKSSNIRA